ncbi:MAG: DUF4258 domain-containing protein [Nitrospirae bacterium]|nr:DUF4258 domain-containing protein [Nitrospirota bacterium]
MPIDWIRDKVLKIEYRFSEHAIKRMIKRSIERSEVEDAVINGEIIEEYPEDKYSPSCLVYGKTKGGRDLHVQLSLPPDVVVITAYEPDADEWIDYRIRR